MEVVLRNKDAFIKALAGYEPSDEAKALLSQMPLVILSGVTGGGRNTIIDKLVQGGRYHFVVSDTTRPPKMRNNQMEQDGVNYFFRTEDEVLADLQNGAYLEAELIHNQQVSGISIRELRRAMASGKVPINEVEFGGTINIEKAKPDTMLFFIVPPSYEEWMRRLWLRESMTEQEERNRLETALKVIDNALGNKHFEMVINDRVDRAAAEIDSVVQNGQKSTGDDEKARQIARSIAQEVRKRLG